MTNVPQMWHCLKIFTDFLAWAPAGTVADVVAVVVVVVDCADEDAVLLLVLESTLLGDTRLANWNFGCCAVVVVVWPSVF